MTIVNLKILSNTRLEDSGKCKSCKFSSHWLEYGDWNWDCTHKLFDNLPEYDLNADLGHNITLEWGEKDECPLWEPLLTSHCEKHGFYLDKNGCPECESDHLIYLEQVETYE